LKFKSGGRRSRDLHLLVQSVPITAKVVSSNPFDGGDKVYQWLSKGRLLFSGQSGFLHQNNWPPRYNWTIVESGVKTQ